MSQTEEQGDLNPPTVQPDTLYELAYNAAVDVLKQQDATLANTRNRASGLLATAALAASFATSVGLFGTGTGSKPIPHQYGWVLLATVMIGVASSIVLWPVQRWGYGPDPILILEAVEVAPVSPRGSGDAKVHVLYATPGSALAQQKQAAESANTPLILGPDHPLSQQAFQNQV